MCKTFFASGSGLQCIWVAALGKKGLREQEEEAAALRAETKKCEDAAASWRVARKALKEPAQIYDSLLRHQSRKLKEDVTESARPCGYYSSSQVQKTFAIVLMMFQAPLSVFRSVPSLLVIFTCNVFSSFTRFWLLKPALRVFSGAVLRARYRSVAKKL